MSRRVFIPSNVASAARIVGGKEDAMYLGVGVVVLIALVLLSPVIWLAWWLLADLGSRASGSYGDVHEMADRSYRRAA